MGASGFGHEFDEGVSFESFEDVVFGVGGFSGFGTGGIFFSDSGVSAEGYFDDVGVEFEVAVDEGEVDFAGEAVFELFGDAPVCGVGFGDDEDAGGVSVESVDNAGSEGGADVGEGLAVVDEAVDEGAAAVAACGVDDEVGLFVDGEEVFVFVDDVEGYGFTG